MLINPHPYSSEGLGAPLNHKPWPGMKQGRDLLALVDADMFVYAAGFAVEHHEHTALDPDGWIIDQWKGKSGYNKWLKENKDTPHDLDVHSWVEEPDKAELILNLKRKEIREVTRHAKQRWYLTKGSTLWRNDDARIQEYKGSRMDSAKPVYYDHLREYMKTAFRAKVLAGMEADDGVAALARENPGQVIVVSGDKDLRTVPGLHLNPTSGKIQKGVEFISELEACRFLYAQMLMGDKTDDIKGLSGDRKHPGWGPKKATAAMEQYVTEHDMATFVAEQYAEKYPEGITGWKGDHLSWQEMLVETANLLFLRRYRDTKFIWEV